MFDLRGWEYVEFKMPTYLSHTFQDGLWIYFTLDSCNETALKASGSSNILRYVSSQSIIIKIQIYSAL